MFLHGNCVRYIVASLLAFAASAHTQASEPRPAERVGHQWSRVQAIPAGTLLHVRTGRHNAFCRMIAADPERLHCEGGHSYARADVERVALSRRGASTVGMAAIGAGVGVASTAIVSEAGGLDGSAKGSVWAGTAGLGALIFAPIGFFGDPFRGPVVYTAR